MNRGVMCILFCLFSLAALLTPVAWLSATGARGWIATRTYGNALWYGELLTRRNPAFSGDPFDEPEAK